MMKLNAPRRTTAAATSGTRFGTQKRHNQQKIKRFALSLHTKKQQALEAFFCGRALAMFLTLVLVFHHLFSACFNSVFHVLFLGSQIFTLDLPPPVRILLLR